MPSLLEAAYIEATRVLDKLVVPPSEPQASAQQ